jgi:hypothetical protein
MMWVAIVGTIAIVLVTIAVGMWVDRKKPILPRPEDLAEPEKKLQPPRHEAGEAPATAIRASASQIAALRSGQHCAVCRAPMANLPDSDDTVRYDERDLLVLHYACSNCPAKRSVYVDPTTSTSRPQ